MSSSQRPEPLGLAPRLPESTSRSRSRARRRDTADSLKSGKRWARQVPGDPWWPCFLTLDGGGIRGYSSLLILQELMHRIHYWECVLQNEAVTSSTPSRGRLESRAGETAAGAGIIESHIDPDDYDHDMPLNGSFTSDDKQNATRSRGRPESRADETAAGAGVESHVDSVDYDHVTPLNGSFTSDDKQDDFEQDDQSTRAQLTHLDIPNEENLLPCHYFDFMFGTSTGGLIATMLGRLRMTVPECLELYREVGEKLFGKRRSSMPLFTKYYNEPLEEAVQKLVSQRCPAHEHCSGDCLHPWPEELARQVQEAYQDDDRKGLPFDVSQPRVCHSCCLTATHDEKPSVAYLLRTYSHYYPEEAYDIIKQYNEGADPLKIWEVTRATSAAPFYFRMLETEIDGQPKTFKDGGIRENNPAGAALNEFNSLYVNSPGYNEMNCPTLLLSIGTGRPDSAQDGFASVWPGPFGNTKIVRHIMENLAILKNVLIRYTDGETLHDRIRSLVARGENTWYKRLNVDTGLQDMPLDDWVKGTWHGKQHVPGGKSLTRMEEATNRYLERDFLEDIDSYAKPSIMIDQTAEKLVRQRRAREQLGGERWDVFVGKRLPGSKKC